MKNEKTTALVLMDLWAFAYAQDGSERTRREFESVCRLGERLSLPEVKTFRDYVARVARDHRETKKTSFTRPVVPASSAAAL